MQRGKVLLKVMFIPFFQPTFDDEEDSSSDEEERATAGKKKQRKKATVAMPSVRAVTTNIADKLKVGSKGGFVHRSHPMSRHV